MGNCFQLSGDVEVMHDAHVAKICNRLPQITKKDLNIQSFSLLFACFAGHSKFVNFFTDICLPSIPGSCWLHLGRHTVHPLSLCLGRETFSVCYCGWSPCDLCVPLCVVRLCSVLDGLLVMSAPVAGPRSTEDNDVTTAFHSPTTLISLVALLIIMLCLSKLAFWSTE